MAESSNLKINNFDLLRLIAAMQVIFGHTYMHLSIHQRAIVDVIWKVAVLFPGVPIFFIISGFLISASFEKNASLKAFFLNRILRIYPALWVAFIVSLIVITLSGYWSQVSLTKFTFVSWVIAQLTTFQFYNPPFLRGFGVGVLNGSLWTISIELQFYMLVPVLYHYLNKCNKTQSNYLLLLLILVFIFINTFISFVPPGFLAKVFKISFLPYFYMFLVGIFYQRNITQFLKLTENKFFVYFPLYLLTCYVFRHHIEVGNKPSFLIFILLSLVIISFAFSFKTLANRLLHKNDISYGLYIYHMIVINTFVHYHYIGHIIYLFAVFFFTIVLASLSWILIENPALKLKRRQVSPKNVLAMSRI